MLPIKLLQPLGKLAKALDIGEIMKAAENIDITKLNSTKEKEKESEGLKLGKIIIELLLKHLEEATEPFIEFISLYKGISKEEAENLDVIKTVQELMKDAGITSFLSQAD